MPLGRWVLGEACRQLAAWGAAGRLSGPRLERLSMWVNLSARQLQEPDFVQTIADALQASGLRPEQLTLEITESGLMADLDQSTATLHRLRALGLRLAIDDFGTGYSSLSYLERLPVEVLKIDRSFTAAIGHGRDVPVLVRSIVKLGQTLHMEVLAEGIETVEQLDQAARHRLPPGPGLPLLAGPAGGRGDRAARPRLAGGDDRLVQRGSRQAAKHRLQHAPVAVVGHVDLAVEAGDRPEPRLPTIVRVAATTPTS